MSWVKRGRIVVPPGVSWMRTHAQNPFPQALGGTTYRIHFAARDEQNRARGAYADLDLRQPDAVIRWSDAPTIGLGELGCFDDCGAMPSCIVEHEGRLFMYYTGWTQARSTPFSFFIGLAVSDDGGHRYTRVSRAPVLGRTFHDPFLTAAPCVLVEGGRWRMWYVSGTGWEERPSEKGGLRHYYHIRYAESDDGVAWRPTGKVCIDFDSERDEYALARPVVVRDGATYRMWFSHRGGSRAYRIGYAESADGILWTRRRQTAVLDVSRDGWDAEMICYPWVFSHDGTWYMLYNGNGYGSTGIGLAVGEASGGSCPEALS